MLWERKVKPDGTAREYALVPVARYPHLVVGRFPIPRGAPAGVPVPFSLPPGSCSDGYFWSRRSYVIYRFRGPDGRPLGHRADAVTDVRFERGAVSYRDLVLDWWILPGGEIVEEDRAEFDALVAAGGIAPRDAACAERAERAITGRWTQIAAELAALERSIEGADKPGGPNTARQAHVRPRD